MEKSAIHATERNTSNNNNAVTNIHDSTYNPKTKSKISFNYSSKHSICILLISLTFFITFQIPSLRTSLNTSSSSINNDQLESMAEKLRLSVTFLPLKDLRYSSTALQGHTWFMSSMYDTKEEGEVQYQQFPSNASNGRILCMKGRDNHDGSWNYYALAWPEALPINATLMKGLTFVSYNHYNYDNIWHGLSAVFPFVAWHIKNGCNKVPSRWVLYHWGELRAKMGSWVSLLMQATFGGPVNIELFEGIDDDQPVCFEEAVVMRHNEGGMSRQRRIEAYDLIRCKAREFCNISKKEDEIGMSLFLRTGTRSFKNDSAVIDIFKSECAKYKECRLRVARANDLSFCEQVDLMSRTDVLVSTHGAQLTNMFIMERNSSVMEFYPKGWLKLAGIGQYVYLWISKWSGMKHQGAYRDPNGDKCPHPEDDRRCMSIFKNGKVGTNETYFREWAKKVLFDVKVMRMDHKGVEKSSTSCHCN